MNNTCLCSEEKLFATLQITDHSKKKIKNKGVFLKKLTLLAVLKVTKKLRQTLFVVK